MQQFAKLPFRKRRVGSSPTLSATKDFNMSSGQKSVSEDEDYWETTKNNLSIQNVSWDVYSREARAAKKLHEKFGYTGALLKLSVKHLLAKEDLENLHRKEIDELIKAIKTVDMYQ